IKLWDMMTMNFIFEINDIRTSINTLAFNPDGSLLAYGGENSTLVIYNVKEKKIFHEFHSQRGTVYGVAFSPDGSLLASCNGDNTISIYDLKENFQETTLVGHSMPVYCIEFSPEGSLLASGSKDQTIKLWDPKTKQIITTLQGNTHDVSSLSFNPIAPLLATGSGDGSIQMWNISTQKLLSITKLLPQSEWITFHPLKIAYVSSKRGEDSTYLRFSGTGNMIPIKYFPKLKHNPHDTIAFDSLFAPQVKETWITTLYLLYSYISFSINLNVLAIIIGTQIIVLFILFLFRSKRNTLSIMRQFFKNTGISELKMLESRTFYLRWDEPVREALVIVWKNNLKEKVVPVVDLWQKNMNRFKKLDALYIVFQSRDVIPQPHEINSFRNKISVDVIPLVADILFTGIHNESCKKVLQDLRDRYASHRDPYSTSKTPIYDPNLFFGRAKIIRNILSLLMQGQHVGIFGSRKIGKTSLIRYIKHKLCTIPTVFIDCQELKPAPEHYFSEIINQLNNQLVTRNVRKSLINTNKLYNPGSFRDDFLNLYSSWEKKSPLEPFVIIFDEIETLFILNSEDDAFEKLKTYIQVFSMLRGLAQTKRCCSLLITAYKPDVNRLNIISPQLGENPMFSSFHEEYLGFLDRVESDRMIENIGAWRQIRWEQDALERVFQCCGGHPFITRLFASKVCSEGTIKEITLELVKIVEHEVCSLIAMPSNDFNDFLMNSVWANLHINEQSLILNTLGKLDQKLTEVDMPEEFKQAYHYLKKYGLLVSHPDTGITVAGTLFNSWLQPMVSI
ncbi:MAG: hypothetical protein JW795_16635, partial [Chitinivibrionales bacterium]|nr:hypothetical protein [Chitinivibrionales bacterium]